MTTYQFKRKKAWWINKKNRVLVLDNSYMPIDVVDWQDAISDTYSGKAIVVEFDVDRPIRTVSGDSGMFMPLVIQKHTKKGPRDFAKVMPLNRKTIYDRDNGRCCFSHCRKRLQFEDFTIEHLTPRSKGGLNTWANLRASCWKCNNLKADRSLMQMGWSVYPVGIPTLSQKAPLAILSKIGGNIPHESWRKYIYWEVSDEVLLKEIK